MFKLLFKCENEEDKNKKRDAVCNSLVGSSDEIMVAEGDTNNEFEVIIGKDNDSNLIYEIEY